MDALAQIAALQGTSAPSKLELEFKDVAGRGITEATCRIYDYGYSKYKGRPVQVANYRNKAGEVAGQHLRIKGDKGTKEFVWNTRLVTKPSTLNLFGQHLGDRGTLILTEGQIDAMSCYEVLIKFNPFGKGRGGFVCASVGSVTDAQACVKAQLPWILGFDTVILFLDLDEVGRKASAEVSELIGPLCRVVEGFPYKDANEALMANDADGIRQALKAAKRHVPHSVVHASDLLDSILNPTTRNGLALPWQGWNDYTQGFKEGELWMLSGGTSIGKSLFSRSICLDLCVRGTRCAYVGLEEDKNVTVERMLSERLMLDRPIHLDTVEQRKLRDPTMIKDAMYSFAPNLWLLDQFGGDSFGEFINVVKHYVLAEGCKVVFLDHFSMLADGISLATDQRRAIDKCIKELKLLAVNLKFTMFVVCHLSRDGGMGRTPEEGGEPHVGMLRGSQSLAQIPDYIVMLKRNPNADDDVEKNTTYCYLKKNRPTGKLGMMSKLHWLPSSVFHEIN